MIKVLKKNGTTVNFDGDKIRKAIRRSAERVCITLSEKEENKVVNSIKKQPKIDYSSLNRRVQDKSKSDIDTADMSELIGQIF